MQKIASLAAHLTLFFHLTMPMRLSYARDRASYALACDEEASLHYEIALGRVWRGWCAARAWWAGLCCGALPEHFVQAWFTDASCKESSRRQQ